MTTTLTRTSNGRKNARWAHIWSTRGEAELFAESLPGEDVTLFVVTFNAADAKAAELRATPQLYERAKKMPTVKTD